MKISRHLIISILLMLGICNPAWADQLTAVFLNGIYHTESPYKLYDCATHKEFLVGDKKSFTIDTDNPNPNYGYPYKHSFMTLCTAQDPAKGNKIVIDLQLSVEDEHYILKLVDASAFSSQVRIDLALGVKTGIYTSGKYSNQDDPIVEPGLYLHYEGHAKEKNNNLVYFEFTPDAYGTPLPPVSNDLRNTSSGSDLRK